MSHLLMRVAEFVSGVDWMLFDDVDQNLVYGINVDKEFSHTVQDDTCCMGDWKVVRPKNSSLLCMKKVTKKINVCL